MVQSVEPDAEFSFIGETSNSPAFKSKAFSVNEVIFNNTLENRSDETKSILPTKNIEEFNQETTWKTKFENWSIFGIRFGVYIDSSTRFVSKCAQFTSILTCIIVLIIVMYHLFQIGDVRSCCNVLLEDLNNMQKYQIEKPKDVESFIKNTNFKDDKPILFPVEVLIKNLNCNEIIVEYAL